MPLIAWASEHTRTRGQEYARACALTRPRRRGNVSALFYIPALCRRGQRTVSLADSKNGASNRHRAENAKGERINGKTCALAHVAD